MIPQPPKNGEQPKLEITCPACAQKFSQPLPPVEISNNFQSSCVTVPHERLIRCTNSKCRQPFIFIIQGAQIVFNVQPVGDEIVERIEGSKLVKSALSIVGNH